MSARVRDVPCFEAFHVEAVCSYPQDGTFLSAVGRHEKRQSAKRPRSAAWGRGQTWTHDSCVTLALVLLVPKHTAVGLLPCCSFQASGATSGLCLTASPCHAPGNTQSEAQDHVDTLQRTVERVQQLIGSAAYLDEEAFGVVSMQTQYSTTILAQEKRIHKLLGDIAAAKQVEQVRGGLSLSQTHTAVTRQSHNYTTAGLSPSAPAPSGVVNLPHSGRGAPRRMCSVGGSEER